MVLAPAVRAPAGDVACDVVPALTSVPAQCSPSMLLCPCRQLPCAVVCGRQPALEEGCAVWAPDSGPTPQIRHASPGRYVHGSYTASQRPALPALNRPEVMGVGLTLARSLCAPRQATPRFPALRRRTYPSARACDSARGWWSRRTSAGRPLPAATCQYHRSWMQTSAWCVVCGCGWQARRPSSSWKHHMVC